MPNQQVLVQLEKVQCVDETGGKWAERIGNDEISLAGFGVDGTGKTIPIESFRVYSHFDDGDEMKFSPPKTILSLGVPEAGKFPIICAVNFLLAEVDKGGLSEASRAALSKATQELAARGINAGGDVIGGAVGLPPEIWAAVSSMVINYVKSLIALGFDDDIFPPQMASLSVTSSNFSWPTGKRSPSQTVEFRGHEGFYRLTFFWEIR